MKRLKDILRFNDISGLIIHISLISLLGILSLSYPLFIIVLLPYIVIVFKMNNVLFIYSLIILLIVVSVFLIKYYSIKNYIPKETINGIITYKDNNYILIKAKLHYVKVYVDDISLFEIGRKIEVEGSIKTINERNIENTFSYYKYKLYKNIYYELNLKHYNQSNYSISIYTIRGKIIDYIDNNYSAESSSYIKQLILGISSFDIDISKSINNIGIIHLFAISGLHINILKKGLHKFLSLFNIYEEINYIIVDVILVGYLFLSSFSISILRVVIMSVIESIYRIKGRSIFKIDALSIALLFSLIINPFSIFECGFYLTYLSTLIIMVLEDKNIIKISLSIIAFTIPVLFYFNNNVSLLMPITTIIFGIIFSYLIIPSTYIVFLLPLLDIPYNYLIKGLNYIINIVNNINLKLNYSIEFPYILFLILGLIFAIFALYNNKKYIIPIISSLTLIFIFNYILLSYSASPIIKVFDVGQGDSILIRDGFHNILIDTGESDDYDSTINYLKSKNITKLDAIFISHVDSDHYGEYKDIIDTMYVKEVHFNEDDKEYKYGNIMIHTYCYFSGSNINERSMVLLVEIYGYKMLFTGDIEKEGEEYIYSKDICNIDILKVAHHGSSTSSNPRLLNKLNPKLSLISCGLNNRYGHPSKETIDTLNSISSAIYRTDLMGSINIKFHKKYCEINTYLKRNIIFFEKYNNFRVFTN